VGEAGGGADEGGAPGRIVAKEDADDGAAHGGAIAGGEDAALCRGNA